jgi:phage virion morphogenesis protein
MFSVEIKDQAVTAALMRASEQMDDMTPLFMRIGDLLVSSTKDRFVAGTAPDGSKWAPKSQTTLKKYGSPKSNRVDVRPLFGPSGMLSSQIYSDEGDDYVAVGSNRPYAAMMQLGGTKAQFPHLWGDIPARPFLGISEEDSVNIAGRIADYMTAAFA